MNMNHSTSSGIPSLLATLLERLQSRESLELEFKAARNEVPKSIWPTISAFANTYGGWLLLGIAEHDGIITIEGVNQAPKLLKDLNDLLRNPQKISYPVCGADDVSIKTLDDKDIIVLRVPAAARKLRPVYVSGNPYTGTYIRRDSGDYHCTKPEVDRMMREASDVAADSTILPHFEWSDLDMDTFMRYRRRYQTVNPASPWNNYEDQRFLEAIGGFSRNREIGVAGITVAGLLLLGQVESLREWRTRHLIDYRLVNSGANLETRWDDRVAWEGNLFNAFDAIYPRLVAGLPTPFRLQRGTRVDESLVHVVLREALVNLLVHADYAETQASLIQRSAGGFLFRNPGSSRVSEDDLLTGNRSDPRNPELVRMFRFIGLAEEAGTGIPKIIQTWRELGFHLPAIDVGTERYEFTLELQAVHLISQRDRRWLRSLADDWTEAEQLALVLARHEGYVDNYKLRTLTGQHPSDTTKVLGSLRSRGFLQISGVGRNTRYQLIPQFSDARRPSMNELAWSERSMVTNSEGLQSSSEDLQASFEGLLTSSEDLQSSSEDLRRNPGSADLDHRSRNKFPQEVTWADLEIVASAAREQRYLSLERLSSILVELCTLKPLALPELATLVQRSIAHTRQAVRSLLVSGQLAYLYPNQQSHPQQKYIAVLSTRSGDNDLAEGDLATTS
ncbi:MAG TPA: RNA-binding domain-containing protein [Ardenticatenaceae bacterium]|jgi:ATP-dependent DNA helicase RecG